MLWLIVLLIVVYLFLIAPSLRKVNLDGFQTLYAHRGLYDNSTDHPENSLAAFKLAIEHGYGIEMDVQLTKDKIPVVFHDFTLKRVCGVEGRVDDYTYEELLAFNLCDSDARIPLFTDFLNLVNGQVPLIVEYKTEERKNMELVEIVHPLLEKYEGKYVVESFDPMVVKYYKEHYPEIIRGQLSMRFHKDAGSKQTIVLWAVQNLLTNVMTRPDFIAYDYRGRSNLSFIITTKLFKALAVSYSIPSQEELTKCSKAYDWQIFEHFKP